MITVNLSETWRRALPGFVLVLIAVLLLYSRTGMAMVEIWDRSETFAHAFVVPPISLWLIWRQRARLAQCQPSPMPWLLVPMALLGFCWLLGDLVSVNSVTQLTFTAMLVLTVPLCLGWQVTSLILFPLLFLFFAVPIGEFMLPLMMDWTASFTISALQLSGVPVYREGLSFVIPSGSWSVIEACSGVRYLIASVMVGTLFAYLNYQSLRKRLMFIGVAIALPILANWVRAYMIVMLAHLSSNAIATGIDHIIYGWVFFGVVMLLLFYVGMRWADPDVAPPQTSAPPAAPGRARGSLVMIAAVLVVLVSPLLALHRLDADTSKQSLTLSAPVLDAKGWTASPLSADEYKPHFENPRGEVQQRYRQASGSSIGVYIAYYRGQDYDSKLVSSNNVFALPSSKEWRTVNASKTELPLDTGAVAMRVAELRDANMRGEAHARRVRAYQVYWVNGRWTNSDMLAKLYGASSRLIGRGDDAAALTVYTELTSDADAQLQAFLRDNFVLLRGWLDGVKAASDAGAQRQSAP